MCSKCSSTQTKKASQNASYKVKQVETKGTHPQQSPIHSWFSKPMHWTDTEPDADGRDWGLRLRWFSNPTEVLFKISRVIGSYRIMGCGEIWSKIQTFLPSKPPRVLKKCQPRHHTAGTGHVQRAHPTTKLRDVDEASAGNSPAIYGISSGHPIFEHENIKKTHHQTRNCSMVRSLLRKFTTTVLQGCKMKEFLRDYSAQVAVAMIDLLTRKTCHRLVMWNISGFRICSKNPSTSSHNRSHHQI